MNIRKKSRILIVSDCASKSEPWYTALSELEVEVVCAECWENALGKLFSQPWVLVLVDLNSSHLQELVQVVVAGKQREQVQLLFMVANGEPTVSQLAPLPAGCFDVLAKPVQEDWLCNKVRAQVERKRQEKITENLKFKLQCEITQNETLQKELQVLQGKAQRLQSMQSIGALLKSLSHEFNNVLGFAQGYLHMARRTLKDAASCRDHIDKAEIGMNRALDLVKKIQAYSSNSHYELKPTELASLLSNTVEEFERQLPEHLALDVALEDGSIAVNADKNQLQQVLMGICENAMDAMGDKAGTIYMHVERQYLNEEFIRTHPSLAPGAYIRISITDQGIGMDKSTLGQVFDPFFTTSEHRDNAGMGLSLAYSIIRNHDGEVTVHSDANHGTALCIFLPELIVDNLQALEAQMVVEQVNSNNAWVLLVEDDLILARLAKLILQQHGYRVELCDSAQTAIKCFEALPGKWEFVVVDQTLQRTGGIELVRQLLSVKADAAIILSGWDNAICNQLNAIGACGFWAKPYAFGQLEAVLQSVAQGQVS